MCGIRRTTELRRALIATAVTPRRPRSLAPPRARDAEGFASEGPIALGHRRLSIIDLAGGGQPMFSPDQLAWWSSSAEKSTTIGSFRAELRDHRFRTGLGHRGAAASLWRAGRGSLRRGCAECSPLRSGMSAGARSLVVARDRFGEKPLLYADEAGKLTFAYGLRALVAGHWNPGSSIARRSRTISSCCTCRPRARSIGESASYRLAASLIADAQRCAGAEVLGATRFPEVTGDVEAGGGTLGCAELRPLRPRFASHAEGNGSPPVAERRADRGAALGGSSTRRWCRWR